ncbi:MAG: HD-GYP domain-containing protein [Deltaproteobacteria bacterium]|jgi:HD-GYP domain-containing protein (c-di-GMP phosphodiesterase class II)|nr:HD-GYP domain-containing protein [Deltaproteobacteria bacterium]
MYHKLDARELRAGMYIADAGVSWLRHPLLYSKAGELAPQELEELLREGYTEAYIDLARCRPGSLTPELEALVPSVVSAEIPDDLPPPPRVEFKEELPKARQVFQASLSTAKGMMDGIRRGRFDAPSVEPVVTNIIETLDRNANALFSLCKLRQTDDYTYTHCVNVSVMSVIFARGLKVAAGELHSIGLGGLFHDVGKALIPLAVLTAPRRLNEHEMEIMRRHPSLGYDYLNQQKSVSGTVSQIVLEHHEQYCGEGYPNKLDGERISLPGRIAAIVDVFDALSSKRVYKEPLPFSKALSILYSMRGKEFFPGMVERFIRLLGIYPIGSAVELENGCRAVVSEANMSVPLRPKVLLVRDREGKDLGKKPCNLAESDAPGITRGISPKELGADPGTVLGLPAANARA